MITKEEQTRITGLERKGKKKHQQMRKNDEFMKDRKQKESYWMSPGVGQLSSWRSSECRNHSRRVSPKGAPSTGAAIQSRIEQKWYEIEAVYWRIFSGKLHKCMPPPPPPIPTNVRKDLSLRLKSDGCSWKKTLLGEFWGAECLWGPRALFCLIKRDALPAPGQATLKRGYQSPRPRGTCISYAEPFLLGKGLEGR